MKRPPARPKPLGAFKAVVTAAHALPGVRCATKYDGSPVLKVRGCFMAGIATHPSAERHSIVVRSSFEEREWLLEDAPDIYYITAYYDRYPLVLARLSRLNADALRDLLSVSHRLTLAKAPKRGGTHAFPSSSSDVLRSGRAGGRDANGPGTEPRREDARHLLHRC